jgi:small GTP-binding protein
MLYETLEFPKSHTRIKLFDTAGQEKYQSMTAGYIRKSHIILACFAVDSADSFGHMPKWLKHVSDTCQESGVIVILIGTKSDLRDGNGDGLISLHEIENFADENHLSYFETSAKSGAGVQELLDAMEQSAQKFREAPDGKLEPNPGTKCC